MAEECRRESRLAFPLQAFFYSCLCVFCDQKCESQAATGHVGDRWRVFLALAHWCLSLRKEWKKEGRKERRNKRKTEGRKGWAECRSVWILSWRVKKMLLVKKKCPKRKIFMRVGLVIRCTAVGALRFRFWNLFNEQLQTEQSSCSHDPTVTHLLLSCDEIRLFWLFVGTKKTRKKTRKRALARV